MKLMFGDQPISPEELTAKLCEYAPAIAKQIDPREPDGAWTIAVKAALSRITNDLEFDPVFTSKDPACAELMLDQIWFPKEGDIPIVFAAECEWGNLRDRKARKNDKVARDVDYDFRKLLFIKSPLKLLVYTADTLEMRRAIHDKIKGSMLRYPCHVEGETYVFVEFSKARRYRFSFQIRESGRLNEPLHFAPLDETSNAALTA